MTLGALGSVFGPWFALVPVTALGILIHQAATVLLLVNMFRPLRGLEVVRTPGVWHLITAYFWQIAIVLGAPLIALLRPDLSAAGVEQTAPQVLIYGWMLQFGYALIPYLLQQVFTPHQEAVLGGSWFSLAGGHAGGMFLLASILVSDLSATLLGVAYLLWFISLLPIARQSWQIVNTRSDAQREDKAFDNQ